MLDRLEALAREATPGPWIVDEDTRPGMQWNRHILTDDSKQNTVCFMAHSNGKAPTRDAKTASYIASANPAAVLKLIAVAREAQALADSVDEWTRDVEAVIGRQPNSGMATAALRLAIAELDRP